MNSTLIVNPTQSERQTAGFTHLGALVVALFTSWMAGLAGMVVPLVVYLLQNNKQSFVARHAAEAFNFNFSFFLYSAIGWALLFLTLGLGAIILFPVAIVLAIVWLVCSIMASLAAFRGDAYRYPFSIRLL